MHEVIAADPLLCLRLLIFFFPFFFFEESLSDEIEKEELLSLEEDLFYKETTFNHNLLNTLNLFL